MQIFGAKILQYFYFLQKNLYMSKKSSNFAAESCKDMNEEQRLPSCRQAKLDK